MTITERRYYEEGWGRRWKRRESTFSNTSPRPATQVPGGGGSNIDLHLKHLILGFLSV